MATQTLVQYLGPGDFDTMNRRVVETFIAAEVLNAGEPVCWGAPASDDPAITALEVAGHVRAIEDAGRVPLFVGIALESAEPGDRVRVCVSGPCEALASGGQPGDYMVPTSGQDLAPAPTTAEVVDGGEADDFVTLPGLPAAVALGEEEEGKIWVAVIRRYF